MDQQTEKKSFWQDKVKPFYENRFKPFWLDNNKRNIKIAVIVVAVLIVVFAVVAGIYINKYMNLVGTGNDKPGTEDVIYDEDEFSPIDSIENASSLKDYLKKWATNGGEKMSSKNVINVLLLGLDEQKTRSDTVMIASINKKTDQIKLITLYRDSYIYVDAGDGKDRFKKLTESHTFGGPNTVIKCVEDNFKIKIDHYVSVNFDTFPKVIDALGGLDVEVKEYEAKYIRRTSRYKNFPYGDSVHLNGDEALVYSRIRKSDADSDVSRARRQRKVIEALIKKSKKASISQLDKLAVQILPFIGTDMSKSEMLSVGSQAILQSWMDYPIEQMTCPDYSSGVTRYIGIQSFWIVDYPLCAHNVQMAIYGKSNIQGIDDPDRITAIDLYDGNSAANSSSNKKPTQGGTNVDVSNVQDEEMTSEIDVTGVTNEEETTRGNLFPTLPRPTLPDIFPTKPPVETTPDVTEAE